MAGRKVSPAVGTERLGDWLGTLPALAAALPDLGRVAGSSAPCLIAGEPGTGRSSLARRLHAAGPRASGPLVEVDPGSLSPSLFESELFGHVAGAFTGADRAADGRVARAEGGSLVLDQVEELPLALQPKLLRVLAEGRFRPLGGDERRCDVRFFAISSEDLPRRVERGAFRRDLFHRLEVLTLRLPPLRERREDLPALIEAVLADLGERFARGGLALSAPAREWMLEYAWPGNLRQLRNVLERALILASDALLDPPPPEGPRGEQRPASLAEMEQRQIRRALAYTRGHQGRAAELLGISRKSLWEKRRRYGIP